MQRFFTPLETAEKNHGQKAAHPEKQSEVSKAPTSFRVFRPPVPVKIAPNAGCPTRVFFRGLQGEIFAASGPWRTSGEWWQEDFWQQEEWDLEIHFHPSERNNSRAKCHPDCGLYLLYYDSPRGSWFARGIYD